MVKKKILLVCYGGGHVKIIEPLYNKLKNDHSVTILALTLAAPYLKKKGIPYVTFKDFKNLYHHSVAECGDNLLLHMDKSSDIEYEDSRYYMGCSYYELVQQYGELEAQRLYERKGRGSFFPESSVDKIIQSVSPDIVITTNSPRAEQASLLAAKKRGIPTLCINDGVWIENGNYGVLDIANQNLADTICVLSNEVKNNLEQSRSNDSSRIVATGTPVFDNIKRTLREKSSDKVTILYADCNLPNSPPQYPNFKGDGNFAVRVRHELNNLASIYHWNVIFRMHPNQTADYKPYKNIIVSGRDEPLHNILAKSDIVLTNISTVGVEGKAMGLGLVSLEGTIYNQYNSFYKLGLSTPVYDEKEIYRAILTELNKSRQDIPLYDGFAVDNILREVGFLLAP